MKETTSEHIARDIREGRFPQRSVPQQVATKGPTCGPFMVERHNNDDGSIAYEIWTTDMKLRVVRMCDDDNKNAMADAELICKLLNNQHPE